MSRYTDSAPVMVRTETTRWPRSRSTITAIDAAASVALTALNTISLPRLMPRTSLMITEANAAMDRMSVTPIRYLLTPEVHIAKHQQEPEQDHNERSHTMLLERRHDQDAEDARQYDAYSF